MLTEAVTDFIAKDMRPVSTVDGEGFLNLLQLQSHAIVSFVEKLSWAS